MSQGKKGPKSSSKKPEGENTSSTSAESESPEAKPADDLSVGEWKGRKRPAYRKFPGPRMVDVPLRIAMEREPFADLTAHAKQSLDREVCGVLVGDVCEDDEGPFLHIKAIIRGIAARQASTHVTYTQETWNHIHETMENRYPKMQIVGWYHSHPGYGVEFSEMDVFIQKNFFSAETQVGLVTDPLGGKTAVCFNADDKIEYLSEIWVDGREQKCATPAKKSKEGSSAAPAATASDERLEAVEQRLNQTLRALDDLRTTIYRFSLTTGMIIAVAAILGVAYWVYSGYVSNNRPPDLLQYAPVPVQMGDKVVLLGVGVVKWDVPPSLLPKPEPDKKNDNKADENQPGSSQQPAAASPSPAASDGQNHAGEQQSPAPSNSAAPAQPSPPSSGNANSSQPASANSNPPSTSNSKR